MFDLNKIAADFRINLKNKTTPKTTSYVLK